jgi:hypothetical protein
LQYKRFKKKIEKENSMRLTLNRSCVATGAAVLALLAGSVAQDALLQRTHVSRVPIQKSNVKVHPYYNSKFFATGVPSTVAVSDAGADTVDIFNESGTLEATLTGFSEPQGMTSDRAGNIYIADTENAQIQVWAPPYSGPPTLIADPGQFPAGVDQRNNGGFLAVTNIISQAGGDGSVSLYRNNTMVATISDPGLLEAFFCAFDHAGNLYVDGFNSDGVFTIAEIAHATTGGRTVQYLTTSNTIGFPGGVEVANNGDIIIDDQTFDAPVIYTYNPPSGGSLGSPIDSTSLAPNGSDPVTFAFKTHNHNLYTADAGNFTSQEFSYPAGVLENTIGSGTFVQPIGVALTPAQMP